MIDRQGNSVRIGRICIILTELDIFSADVDFTVIPDDPAVDRILYRSGMDIVLLHLKSFILD